MMADDWDEEDAVGWGYDFEDLEPEGAAEPPESAVDDAEDPEPITVTVSNPPGTVSVTVLIDGSPIRVELSPRVPIDMGESELAEEILTLSRLARQNAQAGQHLLIAGILRRLGHDAASTSSLLQDGLGLPSAETALADQAQTFAARHIVDED